MSKPVNAEHLALLDTTIQGLKARNRLIYLANKEPRKVIQFCEENMALFADEEVGKTLAFLHKVAKNALLNEQRDDTFS